MNTDNMNIFYICMYFYLSMKLIMGTVIINITQFNCLYTDETLIKKKVVIVE